MSDISRRKFLAISAQGIALGVTGLGVGGEAVLDTPNSTRAASTAPTGSIADIRHVVILMQENRSFDHYFGTLQGVRGFGDRAGTTLPGGHSVFDQPNGPLRQSPWAFNTIASKLGQDGGTAMSGDVGLSHSWSTQHAAWNDGKMDSWVSAKGDVRTLGYLTRQDIPFHYALADAYTICDHYFCSALGATGPNRTYLWSGMIDPSGANGGPAYEGGSESGLMWKTYAEDLEIAGVSWKVYQNATDNFDDNGLAYFRQFADAPASSPLWQKGMSSVPSVTGCTPDDIAAAIRNEVLSGVLPQVSWVVANEDCSEHPDATPDKGARFINLVLQALAADQATFDSTVLILNYDENDGFFDHVPPPVPPNGTVDEFITVDGRTQPIGMGFRVPMIICSPWTRGGVVDSQVYDHTSVIRFLEAWTTSLGTPAICSTISAWRRQVSGDLVGAFDFAAPIFGLPLNLALASATAGVSDLLSGQGHNTIPNGLPAQEPGTRSARALPYQPDANIASFEYGADGRILAWIRMQNIGTLATRSVPLSIYANAYRNDGPWQYTVEPCRDGADGCVTDCFDIGAGYGSGKYDFTVVGPNRFLRRFAGDLGSAGKACNIASAYTVSPASGQPAICFALTNGGNESVTFTIASGNYLDGGPWSYTVPANETVDSPYFDVIAQSRGWYDFTITLDGDDSWVRRYTGHLENGSPSITG